MTARFALIGVLGILASDVPGAAQTPPASVGPDPISAVAPARAAEAGARVRADNARDALADLARLERFVFENSRDFLDAVSARERAADAVRAARADALAPLDADPAYVEARRLRDELSNRIALERSHARPDETAVATLTGYRLSVAARMSARETEILSTDPGYQAARARLATANATVDDLRRQLALRLRGSPELAKARADERESRARYAEAAVYAEATARTANVLMDYAYWSLDVYRRTPRVIVAPYVPVYTTAAYSPAPAGIGTGLTYGPVPGQ